MPVYPVGTCRRNVRVIPPTVTDSLFSPGVAIAVGALCLSYAALVLLARNMDPAGAWAIVGAFWGLVGLIYFAATSRRRG